MIEETCVCACAALPLRLTVCDLAGSERCREQANGERMKEATNINTSLLTLGRCITILRHNQTNKCVSSCRLNASCTSADAMAVLSL